MGVINLGDVLFIAFLLLVPVALLLFVLYAKKKGWVRWERVSWRETENYVRRTRRGAEKNRSGF